MTSHTEDNEPTELADAGSANGTVEANETTHSNGKRLLAVPRTLSALADPTRAAIFERLAAGPRSVGDIAHGMPVSRPAVSQHLRVLEEANFVSHQRDGTKHIYRVNVGGLAAIREWLDQFPIGEEANGQAGRQLDAQD
jgi:DNA-binding transcriptional ArsR family regulator